MVILPFFLGIGRADLLLEDMPCPPKQLFTKEVRKMAMVILLSLLEVEGQTPSSLEDMPLHSSLLKYGIR